MSFHRGGGPGSCRTLETIRGRALRLGAAALLASGCETTPFELTTSEFERHRSQWSASGVRDYRFDFQKGCYCGQETVRPARIEVRDGVVVAVVYRDTGQPATEAAQRHFPSVDELFDQIEDAIRREAASLLVSYDPELGYPTRIEIDYEAGTADDELWIEAGGLDAF